MLKMLRYNSFPVQIEGLPYILGGLILAVAGFFMWRSFQIEGSSPGAIWAMGTITVIFALFTAFSAWFYRNPERIASNVGVKDVLSPADGTVLKVEVVPGERIGVPSARKVSIFMSPFDVHVNRAPIDGVVEQVDYVKGKFFKADLDKASEENEHNWLVMRRPDGVRIAFVQIAGFVARRIVCYVSRGESLSRGERYGMIRFGSRMEILLPIEAEVLVKPGQKIQAGLTPVART
jgi:phosphatidylserine decarboxylase